jgi:hypothetical protein
MTTTHQPPKINESPTTVQHQEWKGREYEVEIEYETQEIISADEHGEVFDEIISYVHVKKVLAPGFPADEVPLLADAINETWINARVGELPR